MTETISIVTVCKNSEEFIEKTIQSVASQIYPNIEYIVVDGGSTDKTLKIITKYRSSVATLISEKDNGIYDAMNKGLDLCHGDLVYFLNSGDYLFNIDTISKIADIAEKNPSYDIYTGDIIYYDENCHERISGERASIVKYLQSVVCHQGIIARRRVFDQTGKFDTKYHIYADYDWFLSALLKYGSKVLYTGIPFAYYLKDGKSDTSWKCYIHERKEIITKYVNRGQLLIYAMHEPSSVLKYIFYRAKYNGLAEKTRTD
ncbi:MAG: glycosyltransferase family 2 protein [Methanomicrobiales archaeon]|nr:glycosyltransferase family 2 protein [Methanomicrobiales archaeon]